MVGQTTSSAEQLVEWPPRCDDDDDVSAFVIIIIIIADIKLISLGGKDGHHQGKSGKNQEKIWKKIRKRSLPGKNQDVHLSQNN